MLLSLYNTILRWAKHSKAPWLLGAVSFAESSFMPIPPDVMLAPMSLAKPDSAWKYAWITTICSVLGGIFGYFLGYWCEPWVLTLIQRVGYDQAYFKVQSLFTHWGFVAVLLAGFTPIPYKLFTITAGILRFDLLSFILASILGRGIRFFMVSLLLKFHNYKIDQFFRVVLQRFGTIVLGCIIILLVCGIYYYCL